MSQHRRRPPSRRRAGRRVGAFLITTVVAASAITGVAVLAMSRMHGVSADPLADSVAEIPASQPVARLEQERQKEILHAAAAATMSMVSSPKLVTQPTTPPTETAASGTQAPGVPSTPPDPGTAQSTAYQMLPSFGWSASAQFGCLDDIWSRESGWRYNAENASGAYGIPQALPGSKMASAGADWMTDPATQIKWGLGYIQGRYGSPCGAWAFWQGNGWY